MRRNAKRCGATHSNSSSTARYQKHYPSVAKRCQAFCLLSSAVRTTFVIALITPPFVMPSLHIAAAPLLVVALTVACLYSFTLLGVLACTPNDSSGCLNGQPFNYQTQVRCGQTEKHSHSLRLHRTGNVADVPDGYDIVSLCVGMKSTIGHRMVAVHKALCSILPPRFVALMVSMIGPTRTAFHSSHSLLVPRVTRTRSPSTHKLPRLKSQLILARSSPKCHARQPTQNMVV
jgi:hypothetical protein